MSESVHAVISPPFSFACILSSTLLDTQSEVSLQEFLQSFVLCEKLV